MIPLRMLNSIFFTNTCRFCVRMSTQPNALTGLPALFCQSHCKQSRKVVSPYLRFNVGQRNVRSELLVSPAEVRDSSSTYWVNTSSDRPTAQVRARRAQAHVHRHKAQPPLYVFFLNVTLFQAVFTSRRRARPKQQLCPFNSRPNRLSFSPFFAFAFYLFIYFLTFSPPSLPPFPSPQPV